MKLAGSRTTTTTTTLGYLELRFELSVISAFDTMTRISAFIFIAAVTVFVFVAQNTQDFLSHPMQKFNLFLLIVFFFNYWIYALF